MSQAQYDIYRRKIIDLTRTMVVKSSASSDAINRELSALGHPINDNDPESWKYYLHLAGEYHHTDKPMTIKSLDTLEEIPFTKQSLVHHLATTREYREFRQYYRTLVARYPEQEDLIKGILNPVPMSLSIAAEDGQILYYNQALVESNEENLIHKLEHWCKMFSRRWLVNAYGFVDDLYIPAHLATMYMLIPAVVMNIRLANCHTNYAHSYHIREYLASHQKLNWAVDYMTKKQMLWLYREIRFIERNAGKQSTFKSLVSHVLTDRNFPLAEWNMRHYLDDMPEVLVPKVEFVRESLNLDLSGAGVETRNVVEMLQVEAKLARGNTRVMEDAAPAIREQMETSINDELKTKILECAVVDMTDAAIFTLNDTLLNHWLFLSHIDRYTAVISLDSPRTGAPLILTVKDAFVVFLYSLSKSFGVELDYLPVLPANTVRKINTPPRAELEALVDSSLINPHVFDAIYAAISPIGNYISTEAFYRDIRKVYDGLMRHRWIWATREHHVERGMVEGAAMHLYHNYGCDLGATETFTDWFAERGLDIALYTRLEAETLAIELFSHATGSNLNETTSLREVQRAMLRIMSTLSSYSVQYIQTINELPLLVIDQPMPRIGDMRTEGGDRIEGVMVDITVQGVSEYGSARDRLELAGVGGEIDNHVMAYYSDRIDCSLDVSSSGTSRYLYRIELPNLGVLHDHYTGPELDDIVIPDTDSYLPIDATLLGEAFDHLSSPHYELDAEDQTTLLDRWNSRPSDTVPSYVLSGLRYPLVLPAVTIVDVFEMPPDTIINVEIVVDGIPYPSRTFTMVYDGLTYSPQTFETTIEALRYPLLTVNQELDGLGYPDVLTNVELDGLDYPDVALNQELDGLAYPDVLTNVELDGLEYPAVMLDQELEGLSYPDVMLDQELEGLGYPPIDLLDDLDGLEYLD